MANENIGSGPHPTVAGNLFDPNVSGNGPAATTPGSTVGLEGQNVHRDGIEHIKNQIGMGSGPTSTTAPSGTNPGVVDTSGGLPSGAGGVSGAADTRAASQSEGGMLGTVKSYLGMGSAGGERTGSGSTPVVTDPEALNSERTESREPSSILPAAGEGERHESTVGLMDERKESAAQPALSEDRHESTAEKVEDKVEEKKEEHEEKREEKKEGDGAVKKSGGGTGNLENRDAIPTAGGEKLGQKHWGESKIVPENPKPAEGTASMDGQPDDETKNNTAKNAGGEGEEKEGAMDKIKHKLHMG